MRCVLNCQMTVTQRIDTGAATSSYQRSFITKRFWQISVCERSSIYRWASKLRQKAAIASNRQPSDWDV